MAGNKKEKAGNKKEMKVRVPGEAMLARFLMGPGGKIFLASLVLLVTVGVLGFTYFYVKYSRLIDQKLRAGPFANTSKIFAAPRVVGVGVQINLEEIVLQLRRCVYSDQRGNLMG